MENRNNKSLAFLTIQELEVIISDAVKNSIELSKNTIHEDQKEEELIPRKALAIKLEVSLPTILKWVKLGIIPKPKKIGGRVYFRKSEVQDLIKGT